MWRKFRSWLHGFNPVAIWREERRLDREAQILIAEEIGSSIRMNSEVATKAIDLANQFVRNMAVDPTTDPPQSWVVRDEDEVKAAADRMGIKRDEFDEDPFTFTG